MAQGTPQEIVVWFDADAAVDTEMSMPAFSRFLAGEETVPGHAAAIARAAYCIIGNSLKVRSVVLFSIRVDEEGRADPAFNLPLQYLAQHAGIATERSGVSVRVASRGQCPVPWHAVNLWDAPLDLLLDSIQTCVLRNRLKLRSTIDFVDEDFFPDVGESAVLYEPGELSDHHTVLDFLSDSGLDHPVPNGPLAAGRCEDQQQSVRGTSGDGGTRLSAQQMVANSQYSARLTEVFGQSGKLSLPDMIRLHTEQLEEMKARYRQDVEKQQLVYLEQLRAAKDEIRELRIALRHEQDRSRRLQELMRRDI